MIAVIGGTEDYLLNALQVMQNRAARLVCNRGKLYSSRKALKEVGWLSVRQLILYHSLLQAKKTLETKQPLYLYQKLVGKREEEPRYQTRQQVGGSLRRDHARLELTKKSWRWRVQKAWGELPPKIRGINGNLMEFKSELKTWVSHKTTCEV